MEIGTAKAIIADGGGYDNVIRFIFDNAIHVNFIGISDDRLKCKEENFKKLGDEWVYVETNLFRSKDGMYDVPLEVYHPMECLQAIIMGKEGKRLDIASTNDML